MNRLMLIILIIGGLNLGLIGLFQFDLVASLFSGSLYFIARIIYGIVGISALWAISFLFKNIREA